MAENAYEGGYTPGQIVDTMGAAAESSGRGGKTDADFTESDNKAYSEWVQGLVQKIGQKIKDFDNRWPAWRRSVYTVAKSGDNKRRNNDIIAQQVQILNGWWDNQKPFLLGVEAKLKEYYNDPGKWTGKSTVEPFPEGTIAGYPEDQVIKPLGAMEWLVNSTPNYDQNPLMQEWRLQFGNSPDFINNPRFYAIANSVPFEVGRPIAGAEDLKWNEEEQQAMQLGDISGAKSATDFLDPNFTGTERLDAADTSGIDAQKDAGKYYKDIYSGGGRDAVTDAAFAQRSRQAEMEAKAANAEAMQRLQRQGMGMSGMSLLSSLDANEAMADRMNQSALEQRAQEQARRDSAAGKAADIGASVEQDIWGRATDAQDRGNEVIWGKAEASSDAANQDRDWEGEQAKRAADVAESAANNRVGANQQGFENWMLEMKTMWEQGVAMSQLMAMFPKAREPSNWEQISQVLGVAGSVIKDGADTYMAAQTGGAA